MRRERLSISILLLVLAVFLSLTGAAIAQVTTAAIHGTVTDSSGAVVANATVTALNNATGIATTDTSNASGYFTFAALQVGGPYTITIEAQGFEKYQSTGTMLTVNANLEVDAKMSVGAALQTVTVSASSVQVETANTQLEQTVPQSQIEDLPMLGRDAASLERLAPGVVESSDRFGSYSANGSQSTSNSYLVDGIDNNDGPLQDEGLSINPDALAEENIITSTLNPEFARNSGAVVNQIIKSGTNSFHGSGFEFYRDTFLNNGNYFSQSRPPFHQNLFGGTVGGPLLKDKLFGFIAYQGFRNRAGQTTQTHVFQNGILPSSSSPGGVFTNENNVANDGANGTAGLTANPIPFDIVTGAGAMIGAGKSCGPNTPYLAWTDCFPVGTPVVINPSSFNPVALSLAKKYVPAGNSGTALAPLYNFNTADTGAGDQAILRADYHLSDKDSMYATGIFQSSPSTATLGFGGSDLPGFGTTQAEHFKLFSAAETHSFNPNNLNEFRAGYFRFNFATVEPQQVVSPGSLGFSIFPNNTSSGVPYMNLSGLFSLGFSREGPQPRIDTNLTAADSYTHLMQNHTLKLGVSVEQFLVKNPYSADNNGDFGYGGTGTYSSGDPGIDYLLGIPDTYEQTSGGITNTRAWEYYSYAQDSWRAMPDLTINYGISWDVETPNINDQFNGEGITCFQVGGPVSKVFPGGFPGLLFPGDPGCNTKGGASTKWDHFGPRLGFAWSPSSGPSKLIGEPGSHQLSIRLGFGLYYNRDQEEGQLQNLGDTPNFKASFGAADFGGSPAFLNPFVDVAANGTEKSPFPYTPPAPGSALDWTQYVEQDTSSIAANYATPYTYNFNLNIQRQLTPTTILQVGYVGSIGHKLATAYEADPVTQAGHAACLANPSCVKHIQSVHLDFPQYTAEPVVFDGAPAYLSIGQLGTTGSSNYSALEVSVNQNPFHSLYFTLAYTYSHALDNASGLESAGFNGGGLNIYPGYQHLSYGSSDYDARQRLVASYNYKIPLFQAMNQQAIVKGVLGDWQFAGLTILQSGFPVTLTDPLFQSGYCDQFSYYACPDVPETSSFSIKKFNPRTSSSNPTNQYFDAGPFSSYPKGQFGNVSRGLIHGPGFNYTDLSLFKTIPIGSETVRSVQLMIQASNAFNHPNFADPDGSLTDGAFFGTVTSVRQSADYNGDPQPGRVVQLVGRFTF
jgi:hypothetical protein